MVKNRLWFAFLINAEIYGRAQNGTNGKGMIMLFRFVHDKQNILSWHATIQRVLLFVDTYVHCTFYGTFLQMKMYLRWDASIIPFIISNICYNTLSLSCKLMKIENFLITCCEVDSKAAVNLRPSRNVLHECVNWSNGNLCEFQDSWFLLYGKKI